jgi:hypothetical protein
MHILLKQNKIDFFTYNPSGELRTKTTGALLKSKGLQRGIPDYTIKVNADILLFVGGREPLRVRNAFFLYLEAKVGNNKQTIEQLEYQRMTEFNYNEVYRVVRDIEEVQKVFEEFRKISS